MGAFINTAMGGPSKAIYALLVLAAIVSAIFGAGVSHERANVRGYIDRAEKAEADATRLAKVANANAAESRALAADNEAQAKAYEADAAQARSDADSIELARQAAAIAERTCKAAEAERSSKAAAAEPAPLVGDPVMAALQGRQVLETDALTPSMAAAMAAIRSEHKAKGRRK